MGPLKQLFFGTLALVLLSGTLFFAGSRQFSQTNDRLVLRLEQLELAKRAVQKKTPALRRKFEVEEELITLTSQISRIEYILYEWHTEKPKD